MNRVDSSHIQLVEYDSNWENIFQAESHLIKELFGGVIIVVEHIGSTSIPGLSAEPIIVIAVLISSYENHLFFTENLAELRYEYDQKGSSTERHFYRKGMPTQFHLSISFKNQGHFWE